MVLEVPSLGPGVAISSTRKDHETGTGAGSTLQNPLEERLPLALTLSSQVVQMLEPLFSAAVVPAISKPAIPLLAGKGCVFAEEAKGGCESWSYRCCGDVEDDGGLQGRRAGLKSEGEDWMRSHAVCSAERRRSGPRSLMQKVSGPSF